MKERAPHRIADFLLLLLLALLVLLTVGSWIGEAAGWPVNSLLSAEGLRWCFSHSHENLFNAATMLVWLLLTVWGAVRYTGLDSVIGAMLSARSDRPVSLRQRYALWMAVAVWVVWNVVLLVWGVLPHGVLLSATGRISPSPFMQGLLPSLSVGTLLSVLLYGLLSNRLRRATEIARMFCHGMSSYADWFCICALSSFLWGCVRYMAGLV